MKTILRFFSKKSLFFREIRFSRFTIFLRDWLANFSIFWAIVWRNFFFLRSFNEIHDTFFADWRSSLFILRILLQSLRWFPWSLDEFCDPPALPPPRPFEELRDFPPRSFEEIRYYFLIRLSKSTIFLKTDRIFDFFRWGMVGWVEDSLMKLIFLLQSFNEIRDIRIFAAYWQNSLFISAIIWQS